MKRSFLLSLYLEVVFLLMGHTLVEGMSLNPNIGSNWSPPRKASQKLHGQISREAVLPDTGSLAGSAGGVHLSSPYYSTLPNVAASDGSIRTAGSSNSFGADGNSNSNLIPGPVGMVAGGPGQADYYNYQTVQGDNGNSFQQETQQQFDYQPFYQNQFPSGGGQQDFQGQGDFGAFSNSETGLEEEGSNDTGFLSIMSNFIDQIPIVGSLVSGMREMLSNLGARTELSGLFSSAMPYMALPMMLPMAIFPVAMGALGLMAFPILQMTLPGIRRSFSETATLTQDVLKSEECVERFSCNLARIAKKIPYEGWISSKLEKSENKWLTRVSRSFKAARTGEECSQFTCSPLSRMQKRVRTYLLGDKEKAKELAKSSSSS